MHPHSRPAITPLRGEVATIAAAALGHPHRRASALTGYNETLTGAGVRREVARNGATRTGLDVLGGEKFHALPRQAHRPDHQPHRTRPQGRRNIDRHARRRACRSRRCFRPSTASRAARTAPGYRRHHRPRHRHPASTASTASTQRPTPEMLQGLDALVFDIQDVGARFYTYETTMAYAMEAAAKAGIPYLRARPAQPDHRACAWKARCSTPPTGRSWAISRACPCGTA